MAEVIRFLLENLTQTLLVLGFVAAALSLLRKPRPRTAAVIFDALLSYFILFSIGVYNLYTFVVHVFFGEMTAHFIGWADSPFQRLVGFASLGFAAVGFLGFRGSIGMRTAAVVGPACFLLGAAGVHVVEMVRSQNFAPGNAGVVLYTDVLIPVIGFAMIWLQYRHSGKDVTSPSTKP